MESALLGRRGLRLRSLTSGNSASRDSRDSSHWCRRRLYNNKVPCYDPTCVLLPEAKGRIAKGWDGVPRDSALLLAVLIMSETWPDFPVDLPPSQIESVTLPSLVVFSHASHADGCGVAGGEEDPQIVGVGP